MGEQLMKAVVYNEPRDVSVKDMPDAKIERPTDVLVKITSTNICGSDLHMHEGRTNFREDHIPLTIEFILFTFSPNEVN
jgi:threonine dehydrogenase-like Zn-dependent dehydrogenase